MACFQNIKTDIQRHFQIAGATTRLHKLKLILMTYGIHATLLYRYGHWAGKQLKIIRFFLLLIYYPFEFILSNLYDIRISRHTSIGKGFYMAHFGGIVVERCEIGSFCSIHQQVKIKANADGFPRIHDQVWIGPHTQITGPVTIGHGAALGAGTIVTNDIPAQCLALGNPARIINKSFDNRKILFGEE